MIYPKPYSIYFRGTITQKKPGHWDPGIVQRTSAVQPTHDALLRAGSLKAQHGLGFRG